MLAVLVISAFIIIVPQNLYNTISSKSFITYMGIGNSDLRIDIQQTDNISEKAAEIAEAMENDSAISKYVVLTTKTFKVKMEDGSEEQIKVELGDHSVFPIKYSEGRAPAAEDEIALSVMNANEMGKKVGDVITLMIDGTGEKSHGLRNLFRHYQRRQNRQGCFHRSFGGHYVERYQRGTFGSIPCRCKDCGICGKI